MGKLKFGVSSIILGKEQKTENLKYDSVEWGEATTIRDFFRAGGNPSPVTPTRCKLLYTAEKLFAINEQISNFAQTYPTNLKASSNEALLFMRRYRFANCSCFSCCFKDAYPSSNVQ